MGLSFLPESLPPDTAGQAHAPGATPTSIIDPSAIYKPEDSSLLSTLSPLTPTLPQKMVAPSEGTAGAHPIAAQRLRSVGRGQVGWVLLVKDGMKLVTSRMKLGPDSRRAYSRQWERRRANDTIETRMPGSLVPSALKLELDSDPAGIGFAFGGVEPGTLHAHGQLHEVHKVLYSIGLAGQYFLHVRLRQAAAALPGSPFKLTVLPGPAHAHSTLLPKDQLKGMVGTEAGGETGVRLTVHTADKMGNLCVKGGARMKVITWRGDKVSATSEDDGNTESTVLDQGDGSYLLEWKSKYSGVFTTRVQVDGEDVAGTVCTQRRCRMLALILCVRPDIVSFDVGHSQRRYCMRCSTPGVRIWHANLCPHRRTHTEYLSKNMFLTLLPS